MSTLGRELVPAVAIGRPRFREYPGPLGLALLSLPIGGFTAYGFFSFRGALSPGFYWFLAGCTALLLAGSLVTTVRWLRFGLTLSLRELGIVLNGQEIPYAGIDAFTVRDRRRFDETATVRVLKRTILIETGGRTVKVQYVANPSAALDETLNAIAQRVAAEPRPRAGKGWRFEQESLVVRDERTPLSAVSAAGVFEREVRLWRHRDEEHFFAAPYDSKNARVLLAMALARSVPATPTSQPPSASGLGRLLFARSTSIWSVFGNTIMAVFLLALGWMCLERYLHLSTELALGIVTGGFVLWIFYSMYRVSLRYRFHERAVVRISPLGTRTLAYANVASLRWSASVASIEHAIPMGTTVKATLVPDDGSPAVSIRLHRFRGDDAGLAAVRTAIAERIAETLRARLDRGEDVPWTSKATFTRDGLRLKRDVLLPYDVPIGIHSNDGYLMLYRDNWRKPLVILTASDDNFYPGLALFATVMQTMVTARQTTA
jgi:hypothetical protein